LKAPKKDKKELDEDDKAYLEKKKAGRDGSNGRLLTSLTQEQMRRRGKTWRQRLEARVHW